MRAVRPENRSSIVRTHRLHTTTNRGAERRARKLLMKYGKLPSAPPIGARDDCQPRD